MADWSLSSHGIADHGVVTLWVLQHGEMACVLQDHQLRPRNLLGHHLGMVNLDGLVVIADRQSNGHLDLAEVVGCPAGWLPHIPEIWVTKASYSFGVGDSLL